MPTIAIASENPVKAGAILSAFQKLFPQQEFGVVAAGVPSNVSDQPMSDQETRQGALNRLRAIRASHRDCDYWAAIEGGIDVGPTGMFALAWLVVASPDRFGEAKTATFPLPHGMAQLVRDGIELGVACDMLFKQRDTKQGLGAIGLLSQGLIDRQAYYEHAAVMAILPLRHPDHVRAGCGRLAERRQPVTPNSDQQRGARITGTHYSHGRISMTSNFSVPRGTSISTRSPFFFPSSP